MIISDLTIAIDRAEAALRDAMLGGDVAALDRLIADDALFTDQRGARLTKAEDLAIHRGGLLAIERLDLSRWAILALGDDTAAVAVEADLAGVYAGQRFGGRFAYSRVWRCGDAGWQVRIAHCSALADVDQGHSAE